MILLDTSASNLSQGAISQALDAVGHLFRQAYLQRQHCTLLSFGNDQVDTLIAPQKAIKQLAKKLPQIQAGGGTPLLQALKTAQVELKKQRQRYPSQTLYLLTDGKTDTPINEICFDCEVVIVDTERAPVPLGKARTLAEQLNARYQPLDTPHGL